MKLNLSKTHLVASVVLGLLMATTSLLQAVAPVSGYKYCPTDPPTTFSGSTTWYRPTDISNPVVLSCSFSYNDFNFNDRYAALGYPMYDANTARVCGACVEVRYGGNSTIAQIVDRCASCPGNDLDLSVTAFQDLAPTSVGRINTSWNFVECPRATRNHQNMSYSFQAGSANGWGNLQIQDVLFPIERIEVRRGTGAWTSLTAQSHNMWAGFSWGLPASIRITDARGNVVQADDAITSYPQEGNPAVEIPGFQMQGCAPVVGTPTFTRTPSGPTPTFTPSPVCGGGLVDDFNDGIATNFYGGANGGWPPAEITVSSASPGPAGGNMFRATGTNTSGPTSSMLLNGGNLSPFNALRFWFKGTTGRTYRVHLHMPPTWDDYTFQWTATSNNWTQIIAPFGAFTQEGWGAMPLDLGNVESIIFEPRDAGAFTYDIDDVEFFCMPNTPTPSVTRTRTPTMTRTRTATRTATRTITRTSTRTATRTQTPVITFTYTSTRTATRTHTPVITFTYTRTRTATPTVTRTATRTSTRTATRTVTPIITATFTPTSTLTSTRTATRTATGVITPTFTRTATGTATRTATRTVTPTNTVTPINTETFTVSPTPTLSHTFSPTAVGTFTETLVVTQTYTATSTWTHTPVDTPTYTATLTLTITNVNTATETPFIPTSTYTVTGTHTESFTASPTAPGTFTPTPTMTLTFTDIPTSTYTATLTASPAITLTPTSVDTMTSTRTVTAVDSATYTYTVTATKTVTLTSTLMATRTVTPANTPTFTSTLTPQFTASPTPADSQPPVLVSVFPSNGNTVDDRVLGANQGILVQLQDDLGGLNLASPLSMLSLTGPSGPVAGIITVSGGGNSAGLEFRPLVALDPGQYSVLISACDLAGNCMNASQYFTVVASTGPNTVLQAQAGPNPNPVALHVQLAGPVDSIKVRVYTKAMVVVGEFESAAPRAAGWAQVSMPASIFSGLANGIYYLRIHGLREGQPGESAMSKFMILK